MARDRGPTGAARRDAPTTDTAVGAVGEPIDEAKPAFVGRQPIFDKRLDVFGYEVLFRSGRQNFFACGDGDQATRETINTSLNILGLNELVGGKKLFFNITRRLLVDDFYTVLPERVAVVELLETVEPDQEVVAACKRLRRNGYKLALDDFVFDARYRPLLEIADMVKIDFLASDHDACRAVIEAHQRPGLAFLAEKIETHEQFEEAITLGYGLFQGYFFCKPKVLEGRDIPGEKQRYLLLLQEVNAGDLDFDRLERVVKSDASISVKLLRYLNSAGVGLRQKITSIKQALVLLGERPLRKWVSLLAMTGLSGDKPAELVRTSLVRGEFCELMCADLNLKGRELDLFMLGLLSAIDALLDYPIEDVLAQLPVANDVKATLSGDSTNLAKVKMMALACERADWGTACMLGKVLGVDRNRIAEAYGQSVRWADEVMRI